VSNGAKQSSRQRHTDTSYVRAHADGALGCSHTAHAQGLERLRYMRMSM